MRENSVPYEFFLLPPEYNARLTFATFGPLEEGYLAHTRSKYRYTAETVRDLANKFGRLRNRIYDYAAAVRKVDGALPPALIEKAHKSRKAPR